jgi:hypothetical protein
MYDGLQRLKHKIIFEMHYSAIVFHWKTLTVCDFSFFLSFFLFSLSLKTVFGNYCQKTSSKEIFCSYFGTWVLHNVLYMVKSNIIFSWNLEVTKGLFGSPIIFNYFLFIFKNYVWQLFTQNSKKKKRKEKAV